MLSSTGPPTTVRFDMVQRRYGETYSNDLMTVMVRIYIYIYIVWQEYAPIYCEPLYQPSTEDEPNKVIRQKNTLYQTQRGRLSHQTTKISGIDNPSSMPSSLSRRFLVSQNVGRSTHYENITKFTIFLTVISYVSEIQKLSAY